ncbi:hypothetical protein [Candidatus Oscillochloris fontis]|uniref:hypothetical protein n=1 Tax=Candidatus Oscillochloris fontis TaxID=2496868 RepID=UPI001930FBAA|nr:hypothetical protein [Candidatus Oscillochloris fontis]
MPSMTEQEACTPTPLNPNGFNLSAVLPYNLQIAHIQSTMQEFIDFLSFVNNQLYTKNILRLESMLMSVNFSSMVGEFMSASIPKYCPTLTKNRHHNGHPDLVPVGYYTDNDILHGTEGIEIKASRYTRGWQGHNPEDVWLMVFVFDSNRAKDTDPKKFKFISVSGAQLHKEDWSFSGRSANSRRTITASVMPSGFSKMSANWIYSD